MYSLRQLEAYTALSHSEQLNLQAQAKERRTVRHTQHINTDNLESQLTNLCASVKLETADRNSAVVSEDGVQQITIDNKSVTSNEQKVNEPAVRRVFGTNQLNSGAKASPKAVTASVFRAIPAGVKSFKAQAIGTADQIPAVVISPAAQSVTASLIQPIAGGNISGPPRQTVVTASLFQPRTASANQLPPRAETMNKSFCMLTDDLCQPNCEYFIIGTILENIECSIALLVDASSR